MQQREQEARHQQRVHRDVTERVAAFLGVPQRACARRTSKALWDAVTAASMEDMLRATVVAHQGAHAVDAEVVVAAMSRAAGLCATGRYSSIPICEWIHCDDSVRRDCCCVRSFTPRD